MPNLLEQEAERLRKKYPRKYHPTIDYNLKSVTKEMSLKPGSVHISEGLIAMSTNLPALTKRLQKQRPAYKRGGTKRMTK